MFGIGWLAYVIRVFEACLVGAALGGGDARCLGLGQDGKGRVETMKNAIAAMALNAHGETI